jgi:pimeloyl-ACP methyl ester carboxylesterase
MKHIFIILHGYEQSPKNYSDLKMVIANRYPKAVILIPYLKMSTFSTLNPDDVVASVLQLMDSEWQKEISQNTEDKALPKIIIIGHSTGALLARKLFIAACGENSDAPLGNSYLERDKAKVWVKHVERIILIAGMSRGWSINHHLYTKTAFLIRIGVFIGHIMRLFGHEPLAFKTRRGASFITQLRIQWISMLRHSNFKGVGDVPVIQLLGTKDDIISPEDNIDFLTGNNFIYMEVPESDHMSILKLTTGFAAPNRRKVFEESITLPPDVLYKKQIIPIDDISLRIDPNVTDVVFVVHGIRDTGYWTQKIARRVKVIGDNSNKKFATETSTYGYFAMLPFLLPFVRRKKVEWLMDQYTENLVFYPNAEFSFVGHSNGTYLLAKSLKEYPVCKFKNVVFAGSVVNKQFEWKKMIDEKRVNRIYNLVASSDWVVAMFPKAFQALKLQDIGSGGFDGFTEKLNPEYQLKFVKGGHGAAIEERYWDDIAYFIVHGNVSPSLPKLAIHKRTFFMKCLGASAPLPFLIILAILFCVLWAIYQIPEPITFFFILSLYLFALWKTITSL